ncbi:MAG TPA: hypothetical protein VMU45_05785 [Candidatus Eisenbacteria bacterium]|nr:hypothetical protein [Candidatus Eisenbacteria bacterium]
MKRVPSQFVVCVDNSEYPASLELRKLYQVIEDPAAAKPQMLRIVDESGEDYPYPAECFVAVSLPPSTRKAVLGAGNAAAV